MPKEMEDDMVAMLAKAPEVERRKMLKTRLAAFESMPELERIHAMKKMAMAKNKLDAEERRRLAYTRLESLGEDFNDQNRRELVRDHMASLMQLPKNEAARDLEDMEAVMDRCHDSCKMKVMNSMKEAMAKLPVEDRENMMKMLPQKFKGMMK